MKAAHERLLSVEEYATLPDDDEEQHELVAGLLVAEPRPFARHGWVTARVVCLLGAHVRTHGLGVVLGNDAGFILARSPDTVRGPDVAFVSRERFEAQAEIRGYFPGAPDLAVEVLSAGSRPAEVRAKVADYLAAGSRLVWVVDAEHRRVTVYRTLLAPRMLAGDELLDGEEVVPGFSAPVAALFET
jgi:Uma2 family endonuclease